MSAAYNDAVRLRDMPKNPVLLARKPRVKSVTTKSIPLEHWQKIYLEAAKNPNTHARVEIAIMVGLRPGEALGLKWSDVDWENSTLTIERQIQRVVGEGLKFQEVKQGGIRTIMISAETLRILQNHKRHQSLQKARWVNDEDLIFTNTLGRMQDEKADRLMFKKLCRDVMVPEYQLYQCRKTAFTNMASQTDLKTLMEFSGHTQVSTVMGSYVFATPESMRSAVNGMDQLRPIANK
jgi:integrase